MVSFLYIVTLLASVVAAGILVLGVSSAQGAPQEAAAAAAACATAIIPYVFTRCVQITVDRKARREEAQQMLAALERKASTGEAP